MLYLYKMLRVAGEPICTEKCHYGNVMMGDIVRYKRRNGSFYYCKVESFTPTLLRVKDLFFENGRFFSINSTHSELDSPHRGVLNYNTVGARHIRIVDRSQLM